MINLALARKQGISDEAIYKIMTLQQTRDMLHSSVEKCYWNTNVARKYKPLLEQIELELQLLWGFEQNLNYYRFWEVPECTCAKLDNNDAFPTGHYSVNSNCPLHGGNNEQSD